MVKWKNSRKNFLASFLGKMGVRPASQTGPLSYQKMWKVLKHNYIYTFGFCSSYILSIVFFSAWLLQPPAYPCTPFDNTMNNTYKEQREAKQIDSDMFLIHRILIRGKCRAYTWTNLCVIVPDIVHGRYTISDYSFIPKGTADPWGYSVT